MDTIKSVTCELCCDELTDKKFHVIDDALEEILAAFSLDLVVRNHNAICNECSAKLSAAFDFKTMCLNTENKILPYSELDKMSLIDLTAIYWKETGGDKDTIPHMQICRLCMQLINDECFPAEEICVSKMIMKYIPEVNFNITKNPVICRQCYKSFGIHTHFLKNCLHVEEKYQPGFTGSSTFVEENLPIKTEEIKLEIDEYNEGNWEETEDRKPPLHEFHQVIIKSEPGIGLSPKTESKSACIEESPEKTSSDIYKCEKCDFETKAKRYLLRHQIKHKHQSEGLDLYKCNLCHTQFKWKRSLITHQLKHRDPSEVQAYKCDKCDYQTIYAKNLPKHAVRHKDLSEREVYECDKCDFKAKRKNTLLYHQIKHKDPSNIHNYKCDKCDYQTVHKYNFLRHQREHENSFKCDKCDFVSKQKRSLVMHQMKHKDVSDLQIFRCDECNYQTIYKKYLSEHQQQHRDLSERPKYKCLDCDFQTVRRNNLTRHQLQHTNMSKRQTYKCDKCDYRSLYKSHLSEHRMQHDDIAQRPISKSIVKVQNLVSQILDANPNFKN